MVRNDGHPLWAVATKTAPESLHLGESLKLPKQLVMNYNILKQMVSLREEPPQVSVTPTFCNDRILPS
jgi:hypothetical protein